MPAQRGRASSSRDKSPARSMQTAPRRAKREWCRPVPSLSLNFHGVCTKRETINQFGGIVWRARYGGRNLWRSAQSRANRSPSSRVIYREIITNPVKKAASSPIFPSEMAESVFCEYLITGNNRVSRAPLRTRLESAYLSLICRQQLPKSLIAEHVPAAPTRRS